MINSSPFCLVQTTMTKCTSCSIYAKPIRAQYHLSNHRHVPQHIHGYITRNRSITLLTFHINIRHSTTAQMIHKDTKNMMKERERQSIGQTLSEETLKEKRTKCWGKPNSNMNYFNTDQSNVLFDAHFLSNAGIKFEAILKTTAWWPASQHAVREDTS